MPPTSNPVGEFDPSFNPYELKKKTVRLPSPELLADAHPLLKDVAMKQASQQEDNNVMIDAQQWNNKVVGLIWKRLDDGDEILGEVRLVRKVVIWGGATFMLIFTGAASLVIADTIHHLTGWK